jgi:hypothetical protein
LFAFFLACMFVSFVFYAFLLLLLLLLLSPSPSWCLCLYTAWHHRDRWPTR